MERRCIQLSSLLIGITRTPAAVEWIRYYFLRAQDSSCVFSVLGWLPGTMSGAFSK